MSYTYFVNESQLTLINISNGNELTIYNDDSRFQKAIELIKAKDFSAIEKLSVKTAVSEFAKSCVDSTSVRIQDGVGYITISGTDYEINKVITDKIVALTASGLDYQPLVEFVNKLYQNPSKTSVDELFLFLEKSNLPITEDGCFIAYKIVNNDYTDCYTGKIDNSVGKVVSMPRFEVDDNRNRTCSAGLHFCSRSYIPSYGSNNKKSDRIVLVKINPADVVSIPSDYNNAKGRCWKYEVVGEVAGGRAELENKEFTNKPVVSSSGTEKAAPTTSIPGFTYNTKTRRWHNSHCGGMVSRSAVVQNSGKTLQEVISMER